MTIAGWLSDILGLHPRTDGVPRTPRRTVDFVGVDWTDNPTTGIATWRIKVAEILARLSNADEPIDVNGQRIVDVGAPTTSTDAATKGYVDTAVVVASGTDVITAKLAVRARMPAQLTIPSTLVTDGGVTAAVDDRILLDQLTAPEDRGIYVAASGSTWLRASDFNDTADIAHGALILVVEGDDAGTLWQLDQIGSTIGGTDPLSFSQAGGGGSVFASIEVQDYAEVGTNVDPVATIGYLRMPFAGPHVTVRNFGNTANVEVLGTSGLVDNEVFLGDASVPLRLNGSTITVATSAHVSMGGYGFTSCARVENAGGGVDIVSDDIIVAAAVEARVTGPMTNIATAAGDVLNAGNDTGATTIDGSTTTVKSAGNIALRPTGDTVDTLVCAVSSGKCVLSSSKRIVLAGEGVAAAAAWECMSASGAARLNTAGGGSIVTAGNFDLLSSGVCALQSVSYARLYSTADRCWIYGSTYCQFMAGSRYAVFQGTDAVDRWTVRFAANVATSSTSRAVLVTIAVPQGASLRVRASVKGWPSAGAGQATVVDFIAENVGGTVTVYGCPSGGAGVPTITNVAGMATLGTVDVAVSTTNVTIGVTPGAATAYTWHVNDLEDV